MAVVRDHEMMTIDEQSGKGLPSTTGNPGGRQDPRSLLVEDAWNFTLST